jgi:hypothetical protein
MEQGEETFISNVFGTVTNKRLIYNAARNWFGGGSREDIPLAHVTSVRLEISRRVGYGLLLLLISLPLLTTASAAIFGFLLAAYAVLLLWGSPAVAVNTAGQDRKAARGAPWQRGQAEAFVEALRSQLFKNNPN